MDYLASDLAEKNISNIKDKDLMKYIRAIDDFNEDERNVVKEILDLVVVKHKVKEAVLEH